MEEHGKHETRAVDCLKRTKTGKVEIAGSKSDGQNPSNIALCGLRIEKTDICVVALFVSVSCFYGDT
jgi:hypothetical protein